MYVASKFSGGLGKLSIHKPSNLKLLIVHAELGLILTYNTNKTSRGSIGGGHYRTNETITFVAIDDYKLLVAPTLYLILEKDIQLSPSLIFFFDTGMVNEFSQCSNKMCIIL